MSLPQLRKSYKVVANSVVGVAPGYVHVQIELEARLVWLAGVEGELVLVGVYGITAAGVIVIFVFQYDAASKAGVANPAVNFIGGLKRNLVAVEVLLLGFRRCFSGGTVDVLRLQSRGQNQIGYGRRQVQAAHRIGSDQARGAGDGGY